MALSITKGRTFTNSEKVTPAKLNEVVDSATIVGAGTMAEQNAAAVAITGGTAALSILQSDLLRVGQENGYATSGTIALTMDAKSYAKISLAGHAVFTLGGIGAGNYLCLALINDSGSTVNLTWPGVRAAGGALPSTLANGGVIVVEFRSFGTTAGEVIATLFGY